MATTGHDHACHGANVIGVCLSGPRYSRWTEIGTNLGDRCIACTTPSASVPR
ncbi:hypothetical protein HETIRDRAFT_409796, partial [Heterobasidion irregulare TC 32-1]